MSDFIGDDQRVLVLSDPDVYLLRYGRPEIENRLAAMFRLAWEALPLPAQRAVRAHWQPSEQYLAERIVIKALGFDTCGDPILGETQRRGNRIEFDERATSLFPDPLLVGLIHHELAHVYANAIDDIHHKNVDDGSDVLVIADALEKAEEVVMCVLQEWGLPAQDEATVRWIFDNPEGWGKAS